MNITKIQQSTLSLLLQIGKDSYPNEFLAQLLHTKGMIDDLVIIQGTITGPSSAFIRDDVRPIITNIAGTAHSHPSGAIYPSDTDLISFSKFGGSCHIILGPPFLENSWKVFSPDGSVKMLEVIGD